MCSSATTKTRHVILYFDMVLEIISFVASFMFNINNYLTMVGYITFCVICFILSFYMIDYSDYNYSIDKNCEKIKKNIKMNIIK